MRSPADKECRHCPKKLDMAALGGVDYLI